MKVVECAAKSQFLEDGACPVEAGSGLVDWMFLDWKKWELWRRMRRLI